MLGYATQRFELGDSGYRERFEESMQGHASPEAVQRYFEAQSLVDETMAYSLQLLATGRFHFVIAGNFHTNYASGIVAALKRY